MAVAQIAHQNPPNGFFSFDSILCDMAYEHADAPLVVVRTQTLFAPNFMYAGHTFIVQNCHACDKCSVDTWQLVKVGSIYTVKQKGQLTSLMRRNSLRIVGQVAAASLLIEPVGRIVGWLQT